MLLEEIEAARQLLYKLIDKEASFEEIYTASLQLDELILKYYEEKRISA